MSEMQPYMHNRAMHNGDYAQSRFPGQMYGVPPQNYYPAEYGQASNGYPHDPQRSSMSGRSAQAPGTVSRNLIGSSTQNSAKLKDLNNEVGLWFLFQDLSVRTEGWFRLKFSLFDVKHEQDPLAATNPKLSERGPLLAISCSNPFQVHSAKKFPGVVQSTELSVKFAEQGQKISIRKNDDKNDVNGDKGGKKRKRKGDDDDSVGDDSDKDESQD